jgi:hypothetical protein
MAWRDFSHARLVCNDSKTGRKWEGQQGHAATDFLTKKRPKKKKKFETSFLTSCQKFKKICKPFLQE